MYSYTFIFKIFGFIRVFLLVSRKKCIKATVVFRIGFACYSLSLYTCTSVLLLTIISENLGKIRVNGLSGKIVSHGS